MSLRCLLGHRWDEWWFLDKDLIPILKLKNCRHCHKVRWLDT